MATVRDNVDDFEVHPVYAVAAVLPDRGHADRAVEALRSDAEVLHGPEGLRILDARGESHGPSAWVHRLLQNWTYYEQILGLYAESLARGEFLVVVPASPSERAGLARILTEHEGHAVYYFGFNTVESITGP
jgi:hypothetical protein